MIRIRSDDKWYADVKKQAKKRGLSVEKMLERSAKYLLANKEKFNIEQ